MRKRKIKRGNPKSINSGIFKVLFVTAGIVFLLTGILYVARTIIHSVIPAPAVFANPYLRQNQFIGIDEKLHAKGLSIETRELAANKSTLVIKLQKGPKVIFSSEQDIDWQISSLHSIMYTLTIENKQPKQIDFRFGKPIVKY